MRNEYIIYYTCTLEILLVHISAVSLLVYRITMACKNVVKWNNLYNDCVSMVAILNLCLW